LGTGDSGKSTLLKQFQRIYGAGFDDQFRTNYKSVLFNNALSTMQNLLENYKKFEYSISPESIKSEEILLEAKMISDNEKPKVAQLISQLGNEFGIKNTLKKHRNELQLEDCSEFYVNNVQRFADQGYIPSDDDIVKCRVRTTGIVHEKFEILGKKVDVFDVGGSKCERKKWTHTYENVNWIIFVVAISDYDKVTFEDDRMNRIKDALIAFEHVANLITLRKTSLTLVFNKVSLFEEKLTSTPLREFFPDYEGNDYIQAKLFLKKLFLSKVLHSRKCEVLFADIYDESSVRSAFENELNMKLSPNDMPPPEYSAYSEEE
jgi:guanine nucleotide-binding protein subunit alpha